MTPQTLLQRMDQAVRDDVLPDDVKVLATPSLAHCVIPGPAARLRDVSAARIVQGVVDNVPVTSGG
jgi:MoxR-like ATPase